MRSSVGSITAFTRGDREADVRAAAESRIARSWNEARRAAVARAFGATGQVGAQEVADGVTRALDAYRAAWLAMRVDAWAATNLRGEQTREVLDRRLACLDRLADQMGALVAIFHVHQNEIVALA